MKYERIKGIKEKEFRRLTGIKRKTFEKILEILKKADKAKRVKGGRKSKLSMEDMMLMTLEYWRENRTYFHTGQSYGISESSAYKNRLLSKLEHKIKITNGRDKIKSKRKTFSMTPISLGNNFKAFNKAYDIFDFNSLTGNTTVFEFIRRS